MQGQRIASLLALLVLVGCQAGSPPSAKLYFGLFGGFVYGLS
jgi:hypothetical protein